MTIMSTRHTNNNKEQNKKSKQKNAKTITNQQAHKQSNDNLKVVKVVKMQNKQTNKQTTRSRSISTLGQSELINRNY